ncbi:MAG: hypothetical protein ABIF09_02995, partial [Gemmatimonadota bacterium]
SPGVAATPLRMPRIGLHKAWVASMDAGWIRYILDTYGIPFEPVSNAEIRAGDLHDRFDVMIFPDQAASQIIEGHPVGTIPPDYVGGIGDEGIVALRDFVQSGGRLICNNRSCDLPIEHFDLPVKDILDGVPADSFNCPGAILKADFDISHPLAYGMPDRGMLFFSEGRVFEIEEVGEAEAGESEAGESEGNDDVSIDVVVTYPHEPLLLSGWMIGDERIRGKAAALDISLGAGKILAFGFNVHNRAQARSTMRLLFNALLYE